MSLTPASSSLPSVSSSFLSENFSSKQNFSYTTFENFLNRGLVLSNRDPEKRLLITLASLFKSLNVSCGYLKGSSVKRLVELDVKSNKKQEVFNDVDFQFVPPGGLDLTGNELEDQLRAFFTRPKKDSSTDAIQNASWFRTVRTDFNKLWAKRIVTMGYPKQNCTTVDLNFSTQKKLSYDTIATSEAIYFDLKEKSAVHVSVWSQKLIGWMRQKNICWVETDILNGLQRLSYRISKNSDLQFIQPGLAQHFFEKATQEDFADVGFRVLANQYENSNLSQAEQAGLWLAVLDSINGSLELESNNVLLHQMLSWASCSQTSELREALNNENTREDVCNNLTTCANKVDDFKKHFKLMISLESHFKNTLSACLNQAMGFRLLSARNFFSHVYGWKDILMVPDRELKTVFGEYLDFLNQNTFLSEKEHAQVKHMKGWLVQHPVQSAHFWLDQIPEKTYASPSSSLIEHLMFALDNSFNGDYPQACDELISRLLPINLGSDATNDLICDVLDVVDVPVDPADKGDLLAFKSFFHLFISLDQFNEDSLSISNSLILEEQFTQAQTSYVDLKNKIDVLKTQVNFKKLPLLLRHNLSKKGGLLAIDSSELKVTVSADSGLMIFESEKSKVYLSPHLYGISTFSNDHQKRTLKLRWSDGTYFKGYQEQGEDCCVGHLFYPFQQASSQLQSLIELGHKLCLTIVPERGFSGSRFKTEGEFSFQGLWNSNTHDDAVRALRKGVLNHYCIDLSWFMCCKFENGSVEEIEVQADNWRTQKSTLHLFFDKADKKKDQSELGRQWGVTARTDEVSEMSTLLFVPGLTVKADIFAKWDPEKCERQGEVHFYGRGAVSFKWQGQIKENKMLPVGTLYLENYKAAIVFEKENEDSMSEIPAALIPVMADLLGGNRAERYSFKKRIWQNPAAWPEKGFECFVHSLPIADCRFSGYIMACGKALGLLEMLEVDGPSKKMRTIRGSFLFDHNVPFPGGINASRHKRTEIGVCNQNKRFSPIATSCGRYLRPHGLCREYTQILDDDQKARMTKSFYFNGYEFSQFDNFCMRNQPYDKVFESLWCEGKETFVIVNQNTKKEITKNVEFFFNARNGGPDGFFSKPPNFLGKEKYKLVSFHATGFAAEFQMKKQAGTIESEMVFGNLYFTCDVTYAGEIRTFDKAIQFNGLGNLWIKDWHIRADFYHEGRDCVLRNIKAENSETEFLLKQALYKPEERFTLEKLLNAASETGPTISYGKDILPHLQLRDFSMFKKPTPLF